MEITTRQVAADLILQRLFLHRVCHVLLTVVLYWLAYIFINPDIQVFASSRYTYFWMGGIMSEQQWGYCVLVAAIVGTGTCYSNKWKVRTFGAAILAIAHVCLSCSFWMGNRYAPGVGILFCVAVLGAALAYSTANIGARFSNRLETTDL